MRNKNVARIKPRLFCCFGQIIICRDRVVAGFHACVRSLIEGAVEHSETEGVTPPVTRKARDSPLRDGAEWFCIIPINSNLLIQLKNITDNPINYGGKNAVCNYRACNFKDISTCSHYDTLCFEFKSR